MLQPMNANEFKQCSLGYSRNILIKQPGNKYHEIELFRTGFPSRLICKTLCNIVHARKEVRTISPEKSSMPFFQPEHCLS